MEEWAPEEADDGGVMASLLVVDDETSFELSRLLGLFEAHPPPYRVRFIDDPYSSPVIFQSSSAYVTINGNEESCGSSFSDSSSSVMASIDIGAAGRARVEPNEGLEADVDMELAEFFTDGAEDGAWEKFLGDFFV